MCSLHTQRTVTGGSHESTDERSTRCPAGRLSLHRPHPRNFFLGIAYGIYMNALGFSFLYPMAMSAIIFGGSLEFIATVLLLGCLILRPIIERRETA